MSGGGSGARPWRLSAVERQALRVLEHLADSTSQFVEDLDGLGVERDRLYAFLNDLERRGWVELQPRRIMSLAQAYPGARLTAEGAARVDEVRARRADPVARARAARAELLLWLYAAGTSMPVTTKMLEQDPTPSFYGETFTEDDVMGAARHLAGAGLVKGPTAWGTRGAPVRAGLTPEGYQCVEDFDADPTNMSRSAPSPTNQPPTYQFNNYGTTGPVAQGEHAQAFTHTGPTPADIDALRQLLTAAVQAVEDADDREELQTHVDDLVIAVSADQIDVEQVRKRANLLNRAAGRVGSAALQTSTSEGTRRLVEWGINLL